MGVPESYFLQSGPQGRLFTWLEADGTRRLRDRTQGTLPWLEGHVP